MPSIDYDAMRAGIKRRNDPLKFKLAGRFFETKPSPTIGDTLDLMDAPEPLPDNEAQAGRACARFIRSMLSTEQDKLAFDDALHELDVEDFPVLIHITTQLVEQYTFRPTAPSDSSSSGPPGTGSTPSPERGSWVGRER